MLHEHYVFGKHEDRKKKERNAADELSSPPAFRPSTCELILSQLFCE